MQGKFYSRLWIKVMTPRVFAICLYGEAIHLQMFHGNAPRPRAHINVTTITRFAQIALWVPACIVHYVVLSGQFLYTVAIFPGSTHGFAVLSTEKLAFQCVTLQT